jgi:hypothetical protein
MDKLQLMCWAEPPECPAWTMPLGALLSTARQARLCYWNASGGGGSRLPPPPRESSANVIARYTTPRTSEIAPVTMAVRWPGCRPDGA